MFRFFIILLLIIFSKAPFVHAYEHSSHGNVSSHKWNFDREISDLRRTEYREHRRDEDRAFISIWSNVSVEINSRSYSEDQAFYQYYHIGLQDLNQKNYIQAIADLTRAIELGPAFNGVYYFRSMAYFRMGDYKDALADSNKATELGYHVSPTFIDLVKNDLARQSAETYFTLGFNEMHQEKLPQAVVDLTKAIEIDPTFKTVYYCLGVAYFKENNYTEALKNIKKAKKRGVMVSPVLYDAIVQHKAIAPGADYTAPDNYAQLVVDYTQAIKLSPKDPELYVKRGLSYKKQNNFAQAIIDYNKALEIDPKFADAYRRRGACYYAMKEYDKSWTDEVKAQELGLIINPGLIRALKRVLGRQHFPGEEENNLEK